MIRTSRGPGSNVGSRHQPVVSSQGSGYQAPPKPVELPLLCMPIICGDLLRGEGLFDVSRPKLDIACRSVFKPSGWVRRRLTPKKFLWVFDGPLFLIPHLLEDQQMRSLLLHSLSPLIVASIFCSMWAGVGGGGWPRGPVRVLKFRLVRICTWASQGRRNKVRNPTLLKR